MDAEKLQQLRLNVDLAVMDLLSAESVATASSKNFVSALVLIYISLNLISSIIGNKSKKNKIFTCERGVDVLKVNKPCACVISYIFPEYLCYCLISRTCFLGGGGVSANQVVIGLGHLC